MPLLDSGPQLNSTCSLKSSNLELLISSGPLPGVISAPFSTFHPGDAPGLSSCQPVKSFPLKSWIGADQFGGLVLLRASALWPVHCHVLPSGPFVVPDKIFPASVPSKTMSTLLPSSSLGEINFRRPFDSSALGSGRAFPQRPTIWALSCPFSSRSSNQEGYSRSGALSVRSHRPRKGLAVSDEELVADFSF